MYYLGRMFSFFVLPVMVNKDDYYSFKYSTDFRWSAASRRVDAQSNAAKLISNQTNYFIVRLKVDQRAGKLSLPHLRITKTEKIELKHKTDEQINPVNGLEPRDQSDRQEQTKVEEKIF